jgi:hypothetical protein
LLSHSFDNNASISHGGIGMSSNGAGSGMLSFSNHSKGLGGLHHQTTNSLAGIPMNSNTYDYHNSVSSNYINTGQIHT